LWWIKRCTFTILCQSGDARPWVGIALQRTTLIQSFVFVSGGVFTRKFRIHQRWRKKPEILSRKLKYICYCWTSFNPTTHRKSHYSAKSHTDGARLFLRRFFKYHDRNEQLIDTAGILLEKFETSRIKHVRPVSDEEVRENLTYSYEREFVSESAVDPFNGDDYVPDSRESHARLLKP
jgi:hypothetical protein